MRSRSGSYSASQSTSAAELKEAAIDAMEQKRLVELYTAEEADFVNRVAISAARSIAGKQ